MEEITEKHPEELPKEQEELPEERSTTQPRRHLVKRLIQLLVIIIGVLLFIDAAFIALVANLSAGILALGILSLLLIVYGALWYKNKIAKWIHGAVIAISIIIVSFSAFLFFYGTIDNVDYDEDVVIILGAGIHGEQVTLTLARRLDKAVEYYAHNPDVVFVVSGGQGYQESITEALAMERYLIARGIPPENIIKEELSTSTYENFLFSDAILSQEFPSGYSAALITNNYHVYRAERMAQYAGVSARHMGAAVTWYSIPAEYLREMMAVVKLWVFPPDTSQQL